jgi:hypothetical protein
MSLFWPPSLRTCGDLHRSLRDHHPLMLCVLRSVAVAFRSKVLGWAIRTASGKTTSSIHFVMGSRSRLAIARVSENLLMRWTDASQSRFWSGARMIRSGVRIATARQMSRDEERPLRRCRRPERRGQITKKPGANSTGLLAVRRANGNGRPFCAGVTRYLKYRFQQTEPLRYCT